MSTTLRNTLDFFLMAVLWAACLIALGLAFRVAAFLFCIGYGCTP